MDLSLFPACFRPYRKQNLTRMALSAEADISLGDHLGAHNIRLKVFLEKDLRCAIKPTLARAGWQKLRC